MNNSENDKNLDTSSIHPAQGNLLGVLTTKPLEERKFQSVYICSLLSNTQFIRKQNGLKLLFYS